MTCFKWNSPHLRKHEPQKGGALIFVARHPEGARALRVFARRFEKKKTCSCTSPLPFFHHNKMETDTNGRW
jgi:hypothetical protein